MFCKTMARLGSMMPTQVLIISAAKKNRHPAGTLRFLQQLDAAQPWVAVERVHTSAHFSLIKLIHSLESANFSVLAMILGKNTMVYAGWCRWNGPRRSAVRRCAPSCASSSGWSCCTPSPRWSSSRLAPSTLSQKYILEVSGSGQEKVGPGSSSLLRAWFASRDNSPEAVRHWSHFSWPDPLTSRMHFVLTHPPDPPGLFLAKAVK